MTTMYNIDTQKVHVPYEKQQYIKKRNRYCLPLIPSLLVLKDLIHPFVTNSVTLMSSWMFTSCQPHWVTSGRSKHSQLLITGRNASHHVLSTALGHLRTKHTSASQFYTQRSQHQPTKPKLSQISTSTLILPGWVLPSLY